MQTSAKTIGTILRIRTTISVNEILFFIAHLPIIGKYIGEKIYGIQILKFIAFIIALFREIAKAFFGSLFLFAFVFLSSVVASSLNDLSQQTVYLYGFFGLTLLIVILQNFFLPDQVAQSTVFALGMDAGKFIRALFSYKVIVAVAGCCLFGIPTALFAGAPVYIALLLPVSAAGLRAIALGLRMSIYSMKYSASVKHNKKAAALTISGNPNITLLLLLFLSVAGLIAGFIIAYTDMYFLPVAALAVSAILLIPGLKLIKSFPYGLYRTALHAEYQSVITTKKKQNKLTKPAFAISPTEKIKNCTVGYRFLNELFIKRHRKVLWSRIIVTVILLAFPIALSSLFLYNELRGSGNITDSVLRYIISRHFGVYPLALLTINAGDHMSRTMYANCDSALLKFSFYRKPDALRKMFRLRLVSVIRYNIIPALILAIHAVTVLALTGGEDYFFQYGFTVLTILLIQSFFSARYMIIYYLLQPYTVNSMIGKGVSGFINCVIGILSLAFPFIPMNAAILCPVFLMLNALYIILADFLVYRISPKTFRAK